MSKIATTLIEYLSEQNDIGSGEYASFINSKGDDFWGNFGAGVLPISLKTKRILISYRSKYVNEPNTYGVFGGKLDDEIQDNYEDAVKREFKEETRYNKDIELIPAFLFISDNNTFKYQNYIGLITDEFTPILDWENEDYKWLTFKELIDIEPKHFGLNKLLKDNKSLNIIKKYTL